MLYYQPGLPLAVIEAKDNNHSVSAGMQKAIATGELIDVPIIFSFNSDAFMMRNCPTALSGLVDLSLLRYLS